MRDTKLNLKTDREAVREAFIQMGNFNPGEGAIPIRLLVDVWTGKMRSGDMSYMEARE
jgi:hypothetical protein